MQCFVCLQGFLKGQKFITVLNGYFFHEDCFKCMNCATRLNLDKFYLTSDQLFLCLPCSEQRNSAKKQTKERNPDFSGESHQSSDRKPPAEEICSVCLRPITGDFLKIFGEVHHPECFKCSQCKGVCSEEFFYKDGQTLCLDCYLLKAHICKACEKPILKKMYLRYGKYWHLECLESNIRDSVRDEGMELSNSWRVNEESKRNEEEDRVNSKYN